jgi:hypothetical protein
MTVAYSKYGNKKVKADGYTFDSLIEYRRYQQLQLLVAAGEISDLEIHVPITLVEADKDASGKMSAIRYEADFRYVENGVTVIEDTKGKRTDVFNIKWGLLRRMFKNKPNVRLSILTKDDI